MSVARWIDVWRRFSGRGTYPHELAPLLLVPLRRLVLSPEALAERLQLTPASRVLEVGPGPGYFSVAVARAVPSGRLELVDIQREMLVKSRRRLRRAGVTRTGCTQASADRLPFLPETFDAVFMVAVLGEVPGPHDCVAAVARVLRPGGLLLVAELPGDPDALTAEQLRQMAEGTPLAFDRNVRVSRSTITTFRKRSQEQS